MSDEDDTLMKNLINVINITDCSLHVSYNPHKDFYQNVKDYFKDHCRHCDETEEDMIKYFNTKDDYLLCLDENILWEVIWYKRTPVSHCKAFGSSLKNVISMMISDGCD